MIYGVKYWNKTGLRYTQNNDSVEAIIKKIVAEKLNKLKSKLPVVYHKMIDELMGYLESCSSNSFCIILEGIGVIVKELREFGLKVQWSDFFTNHANDPEYDSEYNNGLTMDNRDLHTWEKIAKKMGLETRYIREPQFTDIATELMFGHGVMINFPGHYCAAIAYDGDTKEIIYMNPWNGDPRNKNGGTNERINAAEWKEAEIRRALSIWR